MNWKSGLPSGMRYRYLVLPPRKDAILSGLQAALFCLLSATLWSQPSTLRVEYLENPLGIDAREPRLSWVMYFHVESAEPLTPHTDDFITVHPIPASAKRKVTLF